MSACKIKVKEPLSLADTDIELMSAFKSRQQSQLHDKRMQLRTEGQARRRNKTLLMNNAVTNTDDRMEEVMPTFRDMTGVR